MSSVTSSFAQKSGRTKFLLSVTTSLAGASVAASPAFTLAAGTVLPKSTVSQVDLNLGTAAGGIGATAAAIGSTGLLYRDLGREIVVFNDTIAGNPVTEVFREVLLAAGRDTEGVPASITTTFVKVFSSTGATVCVARTG
jgi:hypothetical protein